MTPTFDASPQQAEFFDAILHRACHIMLQAYAGCGKTTTLTQALNYITGEVFMGAYNVEIKDELIRKVAALDGFSVVGTGVLRRGNLTVDVKTIHGAGNSALSRGLQRSQWPRVNSGKVGELIEELAEKTKDAFYVEYERFLARLVSLGKLNGIRVPGMLPDNDDEWEEIIEYYGVSDLLPDDAYDEDGCVTDRLMNKLLTLTRTIYDLSIERCKTEIDFDDQLFAPLFLHKQFKQYDYVFLDEVQDCSAIRQEIAIKMLKPHGRLIFCGDKFQNIYGFTGCMHDEMDQLRDRMKADTLPLSVTYRCPKRVVAVANRWVPDLTAHESAPEGTVRTVKLEPVACTQCFGTGKVQSDKVTDEELICSKCKGTGKDGPCFWDEAVGLGKESVILCRNNKPLVELAYQLLRRGIPCKIAGRDFADSLIKLAQRWKVKKLDSLEERLIHYRQHEADKWRKKGKEERAAGVEDKVDTLLALIEAVKSSGKDRVLDLVDRINTMFKRTDKNEPAEVLTLSSVHKAKGKEWDRVYILGMNRYMPSKWAKRAHEIQAENNIMYVAVTRSKNDLVFIDVPVERRRSA